MIETILLLAVGFYIGWKVNEVIMLFTFRRIIEQLDIKPEALKSLAAKLGIVLPEDDVTATHAGATDGNSEEDLPTLEIRLEQHNDVLYAYRKDNDQFLGQGATKELLIERMGERLNQVRLVIAQEDGAQLVGENTSYAWDTANKTLADTTKK